ncbi:MAG: hypothetical protein GQ557_01020 [Mycoplasmataceae bacterium]|nr:hypothetical protein [Mycoplasmataceae bacterium]
MNRVIAFDLVGGDKGIEVPLSASITFAKENLDWKLLLYSDLVIDHKLPKNIEVILCKTRITAKDSAISIVRKKDSTLVTALNATVNNQASAVISASLSGPLVTAGFLISKPINVDIKPGFAPFATKINGEVFVMLDVGANLGANAFTLEKYGLLGIEFCKALGISKNPKLKLLNIGHEKNKGTPLLKETYALLEKNAKINFGGNIEANKILTDLSVDVVLTEAYGGNIALKAIEGSISLFVDLLKNSAQNSLKTKLGLSLASNLRHDIKKIINEDYLGGAIVIGLNHLLIKAHGRSNEKMFLTSLNTAKLLIEKDVITHFKAVL